MLVDEPVQANTRTKQSDVWHWYPRKGRKDPRPGMISNGDKAFCGYICNKNKGSSYPNGSECVVCAELHKK